MQTFLPYESFDESARVLDPLRLGKQRVETLQILRALHFDDYGWQTHPVVCMWRGHEAALIAYGVAVTDEWIRRGHDDTCLARILEFGEGATASAPAERPRWLGWPALHRSHQSALVRKDPAYYRAAFPDVPDDLPYVWPEPCAPRELETVPPASLPFAAWVVRVTSPAALSHFTRRSVVALPPLAKDARRSGTKGARQIDSFRDDAKIGDAIMVPHGARLVVGEIRGEYRFEPRNALPHVRDARWLGELAPAALRRRARLQDPRTFFALRGEDDPRIVLARSALADTTILRDDPTRAARSSTASSRPERDGTRSRRGA